MRELATSAIAGTIATLGAALAFLTFHAIVIVPVWWSAGSEMPLALICGAVIGGALHFFPRRPLLLGLFLFGSFASTSIVFRAVQQFPEWIGITLSIIVASAYGAVIGRRWRGAAIAGCVASVAFLIVNGGPLTRTTPRALMIGLSVLPVACIYAAAYVAIARAITARFRGSLPLAPPV